MLLIPHYHQTTLLLLLSGYQFVDSMAVETRHVRAQVLGPSFATVALPKTWYSMTIQPDIRK
jgi:hypothetical protein